MGPGTLSNELLERFLSFCRDHRGSSEGTRKHHRHFLRRFFAFLHEAGVAEARRIPIGLVDAFIQKTAATVGLSRLHGLTASLRQFFRFLSLEGILQPHLEHALLRPRRFRDDRRPKYLPWSQVQELLRSVDRRTALGKRDFAILTLMAYQGLRSWDVACLRTDDIRWDSQSLFLRHRKNARSAHLPLAPVVQEALKDYLAVRPEVPFPDVFVARRPPYHPLRHATYLVARRHLQRCFGDSLEPPRGAYRLRHSFAKMLLDQGAPLAQISQLMGHAHLESTLIYTRVATQDLREVADNYADFL